MKVLASVEATGPVTGLAHADAVLAGGHVALTNSNTWYDGPSITLGAGTWMVFAQALYRRGATAAAAHITVKITDGTSDLASNAASHASVAAGIEPLFMFCTVTLAVETTIKIQMATNVGSADTTMRLSAPVNTAGNNATRIAAMRVL